MKKIKNKKIGKHGLWSITQGGNNEEEFKDDTVSDEKQQYKFMKQYFNRFWNLLTNGKRNWETDIQIDWWMNRQTDR